MILLEKDCGFFRERELVRKSVAAAAYVKNVYSCSETADAIILKSSLRPSTRVLKVLESIIILLSTLFFIDTKFSLFAHV